VSLEKDVDGIHPINLRRLAGDSKLDPTFVPCTPLGCMELLERLGIDLEKKHVVVIGCSSVVGFPTALLLKVQYSPVGKGVTSCLCRRLRSLRIIWRVFRLLIMRLVYICFYWTAVRLLIFTSDSLANSCRRRSFFLEEICWTSLSTELQCGSTWYLRATNISRLLQAEAQSRGEDLAIRYTQSSWGSSECRHCNFSYRSTWACPRSLVKTRCCCHRCWY
jgi:hypothetical protein